MIDTVEALFSCFTNHLILRSELNRMFRWLKNRGLTAVVTAERGGASLSRYGIEEYVSDCVVVLDHRVTEEVSTRRLRILKYRGSSHGTSEYPFLIDDRGFSIMPISSADLDHDVSTEFVTSGIAGIDEMLDGKGYYRGSTMLISGTSGTGKTSVAMAAACAASQRGERSIVFAFEESPSQIVRNMESIGLELSSQLDSGALQIDAVRPSIFGLEQHLLQALRKIESFAPDFVVIDPISGFSGPTSAVSQMLIRLIDALKSRGITAVLTYLAASGDQVERTAESISSLADTWVLLKLVEHNGERQRTIGVLKSRGMRHSNQVRRFDITAQGIEVRPPYTRTLDV